MAAISAASRSQGYSTAEAGLRRDWDYAVPADQEVRPA